MNVCKKCGIEKELDCFDKRPDTKHGFRPECKDCRKTYWRKNYLAKKFRWKEWQVVNADRISRVKTAYCETLKGKYGQWKGGAKTRNIKWEITFEDLQSIPMICYYTGKQLTLECNKYLTVSLDRLDSSKHYTKDNVVYCCGFINLMKSDLSEGQFIAACREITMYYDKQRYRKVKYD